MKRTTKTYEKLKADRLTVLSSFTVSELKNKTTFWTVKKRLMNIDRSLIK